MLKISGKLASENNGQRLHKVAVATQTSRIINCMDFNGECNQYLAFLSAAVRHSQDGELTDLESSDLEERVVQLKSAIVEGRAKIKKALLK